MSYPENDKQWRESTVLSVFYHDDQSCGITDYEGWAIMMPKDCPMEPKEGMVIRYYGKGIGCTVRGLYLDGNDRDKACPKSPYKDKSPSQIAEEREGKNGQS